METFLLKNMGHSRSVANDMHMGMRSEKSRSLEWLLGITVEKENADT